MTIPGARFIDHLLEGDHASRPSASSVPKGALYSCTTHGKIYKSDGVSTWSDWATLGGSGSGDVVGPGSATDNAITRFDSTTGKLVQNSSATVDDSGGINIPTGQTYNINGSPHTHAGGSPNWLGLKTFAAPSSSGWSWDNQGSGTIDSTAGYEYQYCPAKGGVQLQLRYRTPANSHYRIDAAFIVGFNARGTMGDGGLYFGFRDSGGKCAGFMDFSEGGAVTETVYKWNSSTSVNGQYTKQAANPMAWNSRSPVFLRIEYDGTNITFYRSIDAYHYEQYYQTTLTNFLASGTPNVCWGAYCNSGSLVVALVSYEETALP